MDKIKQKGITFEGDLAFVNDWELFWSGKSCSFLPSTFYISAFQLSLHEPIY